MFEQTGKSFSCNLQTNVTNVGHIGKLMCVRPEISRVGEHGMSCASEISSDGGFKREHVEYCPSATKIIISTLLQCPWLPNLTGS